MNLQKWWVDPGMVLYVFLHLNLPLRPVRVSFFYRFEYKVLPCPEETPQHDRGLHLDCVEDSLRIIDVIAQTPVAPMSASVSTRYLKNLILFEPGRNESHQLLQLVFDISGHA